MLSSEQKQVAISIWLLMFTFADFSSIVAANMDNYPRMPEVESLVTFCPLDATSGLFNLISNSSSIISEGVAELNSAPGPLFGRPDSSYTISDTKGIIGHIATELPASFTLSFYYQPSATTSATAGIFHTTQLSAYRRSNGALGLLWNNQGSSASIPIASWAMWNFFALTFDKDEKILRVFNGSAEQLGWDLTAPSISTGTSRLLSLGSGGYFGRLPILMNKGDALSCFAIFNKILKPIDIAKVAEACPPAESLPDSASSSSVITKVAPATTTSHVNVTKTVTTRPYWSPMIDYDDNDDDDDDIDHHLRTRTSSKPSHGQMTITPVPIKQETNNSSTSLTPAMTIATTGILSNSTSSASFTNTTSPPAVLTNATTAWKPSAVKMTTTMMMASSSATSGTATLLTPAMTITLPAEVPTPPSPTGQSGKSSGSWSLIVSSFSRQANGAIALLAVIISLFVYIIV